MNAAFGLRFAAAFFAIFSPCDGRPPGRLELGVLYYARTCTSVPLFSEEKYGLSAQPLLGCGDPGGERLPFRIGLRVPVLVARMELGAARVMRQRHRQQAALERHTG